MTTEHTNKQTDGQTDAGKSHPFVPLCLQARQKLGAFCYNKCIQGEGISTDFKYMTRIFNTMNTRDVINIIIGNIYQSLWLYTFWWDKILLNTLVYSYTCTGIQDGLQHDMARYYMYRCSSVYIPNHWYRSLSYQ